MTNSTVFSSRGIVLLVICVPLLCAQAMAVTTFKQFYHYPTSGLQDGDEYIAFHNDWIMNGIANTLDANTIAEPAKARFTFASDGVTIDSLRWLGQLPDALPLSELNVPGTHDSMSYRHYNSTGSYNNLATAHHQTQSANLRNQLDSGIRYLDIRIRNKDGVMTAVHADSDMITRFDVILKTIKQFLDEYPRETVFMRLKKEGGTDHTDNTFAFILDSYILGERHIAKVAISGDGSSKPAGWAACVYRHVAAAADHWWCRKSGNDLSVDGHDGDTYAQDFSNAVYQNTGNYHEHYSNQAVQQLTLGEVRGTLVIFKDFQNDEQHSGNNRYDANACGGDQTPASAGGNHCSRFAPIVYGSSAFTIQDNWYPFSFASKQSAITAYLNYAKTRLDSAVYIHHLSANKGIAGHSPRDYAEAMNPYTYAQLPDHNSYRGIIAMDYPGQDLIRKVIQLNDFSPAATTAGFAPALLTVITE